MLTADNKGKLVRWNEEKGYGFIKPDNGSIDIFIHISTLREMSRLPIVGDIIFYQTGFDDKGKIRAINAKIEGVPSVLTLKPIVRKSEKTYHKPHSSYKHRTPNTSQSTNWIFPVILILVAAGAFYNKVNNQASKKEDFKSTVTEIAKPIKVTAQFKCEGKVYCSSMHSYEEALFYVRNCPDTRMDGDGDGEPCERQFDGS